MSAKKSVASSLKNPVFSSDDAESRALVTDEYLGDQSSSSVNNDLNSILKQITKDSTPVSSKALKLGFPEEKDDECEDMQLFLNRRKHFFILSSAGKPIYSMHGSEDIIVGYMGLIQTIVSYFHLEETAEAGIGTGDLRSFKNGDVCFTFENRYPIILMGVSNMQETDVESTQQLDFLYNYLVTTLSKPHINKVFRQRESFDFRKLLGHADVACLNNICADLANNSNLGLIIGGLPCLKVKRHIRVKLEQILLRYTSPSVLYGLLLGPEGKLITVMRPRRHTLHTADLQLLFSMIFNTNTFKTSSTDKPEFQVNEEFWVPVCLPRFNSNGFLYAFIQFWQLQRDDALEKLGTGSADQSVNPDTTKMGLILLSPYKDQFYQVRDISKRIIDRIMESSTLYKELYLSMLTNTPPEGICPLISDFIFKSKKHAQYFLIKRDDDGEHERMLRYIYSRLHSAVVTNTLVSPQRSTKCNGENILQRKIITFDSSNFIKYTKWKVSSSQLEESFNMNARISSSPQKNDIVTGFVISTPSFELYMVRKGSDIDKKALAQTSKKIIKWCLKNEGRLFVSGGAVF
ncbi:Vacuolar fusion protein [Komagataella phaffii CBS 7435]|uniref:Vacuolar fusion protein MON1 n=2 Tax=Komagataella phaffii TaxID=460519 RepID=C4R6I8_KOMPG|nr:Protein required for fusion of cvt-vesicles and autophagosomes with the vacuole [Komagataella phaffii GS115]AOA63565.1 GQ67_04248T0 [Komagataella phaffii]CAH2448980.1 Vacuolar fusion protein [Komagataella phaffii CBS 7435]AOA68574.1 GQ68_04220T0 [Komagataella phaffii GS115]CAY71174.1 Protein required for fusion of cvt-vesicles and autophagosomes with the vacuole [Komagataella phaffii GS115]CCA39028.1 Vacuolar fusion protein [Komagataella phaffii CBS 7435]